MMQNMKKILALRREFSRGQSFIELALVFMVLMLLFAGVVELGNLINLYLDIIDSAREGARFSNSINFYVTDPVTHAKSIGSEVYDRTSQVVWATLNPGCHLPLPDSPGAANCPANEMKIPFDPATDDIVVSIVSYDGHSILRFPASGWSRFGNHVTAVSNAQLASLLDPTAPGTGFVLVEVFYDYHQLLGMPFFTDVLPDPIPVHAYSIMPYPNSEPTPTPLP
jgi:hypothetical protein